MIVTDPTLVLANIFLTTLSFFIFALYLRHIRVKWVLSRTMSNIIAIPIWLIMVYGIYVLSINIKSSYNMLLFIHHLLLNIPIIILSFIWIIRKK